MHRDEYCLLLLGGKLWSIQLWFVYFWGRWCELFLLVEVGVACTNHPCCGEDVHACFSWTKSTPLETLLQELNLLMTRGLRSFYDFLCSSSLFNSRISWTVCCVFCATMIKAGKNAESDLPRIWVWVQGWVRAEIQQKWDFSHWFREP